MPSDWLHVVGALAALVLPLAVAWLIAGRRNGPVVRSSPPPHQAPPE